MVCLILVAFGCQKGEELSIIEETTTTTVSEDGSYKGCPSCPTPSLYANPSLILLEDQCPIPFADEEDAACIAEDNPYMMEIFISNGNLGIFSLKRNPFYEGLTLTQGAIRWRMKNGSWSSDCGSSYVFDDGVAINSNYLVELEVKNIMDVVVINTSLCFNVDENQIIRNCETQEIINFECNIPSDLPAPQQLPNDPGGTLAIILF